MTDLTKQSPLGVYVEHLNMVKRHERARSQADLKNPQAGGIVEKEGPIHVSNVMLVEGNGVTRVGFRREQVQKRRPDGSTYTGHRGVRVSRKTGKDV